MTDQDQARRPIAHTRNDDEHYHDLAEHLTAVAELAQRFAGKFGAGDQAYVTGLWHDFGKFQPAFQDYLRAQEENRDHPMVPHAVWGAALVYLMRENLPIWRELALPIYGHHAGLKDAGSLSQILHMFIEEREGELRQLTTNLRELPAISDFRIEAKQGTDLELFIRMIFSTLVDADRLDTERHTNPDRAVVRGDSLEIGSLLTRFEGKQKEFIASCDTSKPINEIRDTVYRACCDSAARKQGMYRLTVPTGGGKTRSSLAFALRHAKEHDLDRVIVALPYTSIIDQTAKEYRQILGNESVLEHHSLSPVFDDESQAPEKVRLRLATENWDVPVVVTTTVQLFESLMSDHTSRARKLHRIARSVVILDEIQALPTELLEPTLDVLRALVDHFHVTVVFSSATQPAFAESPYIKVLQGRDIHEIVPDYLDHFLALRRVTYEVRSNPLAWADLAAELQELSQFMIVLNTRRDALRLVQELGATDDVFHLSSLMCAAHRRCELSKVRVRLAKSEPVKLVSTQVVEAGVDISFPTVWRALGPLDRIIQVAGRCNREAERDRGHVVIFIPAEGGAPRGPYKAGIEETKRLLGHHDPEDLHDPAIATEYFQSLYTLVPLDKKQIQPDRVALNYPEVAEKYRLIPDETVPVVVDYGKGMQRLKDWQASPSRRRWQRLQPYLVNLYDRDAQRLLTYGWLRQVSDYLYHWEGDNYNHKTGLPLDLPDPTDLII